jgi:hypothetical protein
MLQGLEDIPEFSDISLMQAKDERFLLAGQKIKAGHITRFSDIFKVNQ